MAVYRIAKDSLFLTELPMYGEKRLGVIKENKFLMKKPTQNGMGTPVIVTEGKPPAKTSIYPLGKKHYETTDWLGNVRVTYTDKKSWQQNKFALNVSSSQDYYPFGAVMKGRKYNLTAYRYAFNTQERVPELNESHYTALYWEYDGRLARRWNRDPKPMVYISDYAVMANNPIWFNDVLGDTVWVYATTLPGASPVLGVATHTFIVVKTSDNEIHYYVYGPADSDKPFGGSQLIRTSYNQDKEVYQGKNTVALKAKILVQVPEGISSDEFDQAVIQASESFGNNPEIEYNAVSDCQTTGNCNSSTSTILYKAGVSMESIENIEKNIPGLNWGFGDIKPWTSDEQKSAVENKKKKENQELNKIIEKSKSPTGPKL